MKTEIKNEDGITIFLVDGDIDSFSVAELDRTVAPELKRKLQSVLIDLTDVMYLDSSAIGYFINKHQELQKSGHTLSLVNANDETLQLLKLTYVDHILEIYSSYDEIKSLKKR